MRVALLALALSPQERLLDRECGGTVFDGLRWLRSAQKADGSWEERSKEHTVGVTALALLAFLGADALKDDAVTRGLAFLAGRQDREGGLAPREGTKFLYDHILGTIALSEAYRRTRADSLEGPLRKAVDYLLAAKNPGKGWRYAPKCIDNDASVTGWALLALQSAGRSGLAIPKEAVDEGRAWVGSVTDEKGRPGYTHKGVGKIYLDTPLFDPHETRAALARLSIPEAPGLDLVRKDAPDATKRKVDFLYWFLAGAALRAADDPAWAEWKKALVPILRRLQETDGGWPAADEHSTYETGRAYATALATLTLELCGGYPGVFLIKAK